MTTFVPDRAQLHARFNVFQHRVYMYTAGVVSLHNETRDLDVLNFGFGRLWERMYEETSR